MSVEMNSRRDLLKSALAATVLPAFSRPSRSQSGLLASDQKLRINTEQLYTSHCTYFPNEQKSLILEKIEASGIQITDFRDLQDDVWRTVSKDVTISTGESVGSLVAILKDDVTACLARSGKKIATGSFVFNWLLAEAIGAWTLLNFGYDFKLAESDSSIIDRMTAQDYLNMERRQTICGGVSRFIREIARKSGLKAYYVGGYFREIGFDISRQSGANHGWVSFGFDGLLIPCDATSAAFHRYDYLKPPVKKISGKLSHAQMFPITRTDWEVFLSSYYPQDEAENRAGDKQNRHSFIDYDLKSWKDSSNLSVDSIVRSYKNQDKRRIQEK
jgi:hypothetical protein